MTQNRLTTRPATTRRHMVGGSLIGAVAVAGAAFGIVTPAHAGGVIPNIGSTLVVTKVDSATSAPLDGAKLNVCISSSTGESLAERIASTDAAIAHLRETDDIPALQAEVTRLTSERDTEQSALDTANANSDLDVDAAAAQAVLDAYAPMAAELDALRAASAEATATWQATVAEIRALQDAGEPVPADLAMREAEEQDAAETAAQAAADYAATHVTEADAAIAAQGDLDRLAAAQQAVIDAQTALTNAENALANAQSVLDTAYGEPDERKISVLTAMRDAIAAQQAVDGDVQPTTDGDLTCYLLTSHDGGVVSVPIAYGTSGTVTVTEVAAPEGYDLLDGTITATATPGLEGSTSTTSWETDDEHLIGAGDRNELSDVQTGGAVHNLTLTNDAIPEEPEIPTEPEVPTTPPTTPPVVPPTTPPAPPVVPEAPAPSTPTTLAYTGTDGAAPVVLGSLAALLAGAAGMIAAFRRRTS